MTYPTDLLGSNTWAALCLPGGGGKGLVLFKNLPTIPSLLRHTQTKPRFLSVTCMKFKQINRVAHKYVLANLY